MVIDKRTLRGAPMRDCPNCGTKNHVKLRNCRNAECGFEFPPKNEVAAKIAPKSFSAQHNEFTNFVPSSIPVDSSLLRRVDKLETDLDKLDGIDIRKMIGMMRALIHYVDRLSGEMKYHIRGGKPQEFDPKWFDTEFNYTRLPDIFEEKFGQLVENRIEKQLIPVETTEETENA